jgi:beta-1,4-mannosyl-glycoprotein beta-1,4-N-acetylglucosaminyltransferase
MLEYRLSILYPYMDAFVLVESTRTHKGSLKPLYYQENKERYAKYADKIVHVVVEDLLAEPKIDFDLTKGEQWVNEKHQRDGISLGIDSLAKGAMGWNLEEKDILFISDADEIIDMNKIDNIRSSLEIPEFQGIFTVTMDMYYYHLQNKLREIWDKAKVITYSYYLSIPYTQYHGVKSFRNISEKVRLLPSYGLKDTVFGWHLSYFGSPDMISNKLKEFGHQEFNSSIFTNPESIKQRIEKGADILGRPKSMIDFDKIELSENTYLPPYPPCLEGIEPLSLFPFSLS